MKNVIIFLKSVVAAVAAICFVTLGFGSAARVSADTIPPYISSVVPPPGSIEVAPSSVVTVLVGDDDSGVDPNSITLELDGIIVEPIIEPADFSHFFRVIYQPDAGHEFAYGARVTVAFSASDMNNNSVQDSWQFQIADNRSGSDSEPVYPLNGYWTSFDRDGQMVRFSWSKSLTSSYYRLALRYSASDAEQAAFLDLGPDNTNEAFGIVTASFPVESQAWQQLVDIQQVTWQVATLSSVGSEPTSGYSRPYTVKFTPLGAPSLMSPIDHSRFTSQTPPIFRWETNSAATSYLFGMIRMDDSGNYVGDPLIGEIPFFINELPISLSNWRLIGQGDWIWTVVAVLPDDSYSPYMLSSFLKN